MTPLMRITEIMCWFSAVAWEIGYPNTETTFDPVMLQAQLQDTQDKVLLNKLISSDGV